MVRKTCNLLIREDNSTAENLPDIMQEQVKFNSQLYTLDKSVRFTCQNSSDQKLSAQHISDLNRKISYQELTEAVKTLKTGKSPGPDGLPVEIYQLLWPINGPVMHEAYEEIFKKERMYEEAMQGVLNLIPKQNKDTRYLTNLRLITLLNVDYKIIEKMIVRRIQRVLPYIISPDQAGFMKKTSRSYGCAQTS